MSFLIKRFFSLFLSLATVLMCFSGCGANVNKQKVNDFKVTAYIRGDYIKSADDLEPQDFDIITDVILFECASFDSQGNVVYDEGKLETVLFYIRDAIGERDVDISLNLLGPGGETDSTVWEEQMESQSDEHNKAFNSGILEDNIIKILDKYGFDGVHFDYEYPISHKAWRKFNKFLVSLNEKLGDYTLGVTVSDWNINFTKSAVKAIDTFELMVYDFSDDKGRHATYEDTVAHIKSKGVLKLPSEKVNIGLPFYSRPTDMDAYWYGYNSCYDKIDENGWYHCPETEKDFWFNTPDVIKKKTAYAINNGFGGVMVWHYGCDISINEDDSLFNAIGTTVREYY